MISVWCSAQSILPKKKNVPLQFLSPTIWFFWQIWSDMFILYSWFFFLFFFCSVKWYLFGAQHHLFYQKKMYPSNFYHQLFDFFDKFDLICLYFTTDFFFLFFFCRILYSWLYKFTADFTNLYALQLTLQICMLYFQLEDCIT